MILDTESIYANSTLASKPDPQIFHYDDTTVETTLKVNNEIPVVEDKTEVVSDPDIKKHEINTNSLHMPNKLEEVKNIPGLHALNTVGTSVNGGRKENEDQLYSNSINSFEDETDFYTDKNVTEVELPKVMVCSKEVDEGDYHAVKDICIDDGFPSFDRFLVENGDIHSKVTFNSMHLDLDVDNVLSKVNAESPVPILSGTNPSIESESKPDVTNDYSCENLNRNSDEDNDETENVDSVVSSVFNWTNPFLECDGDSELDFAKKSYTRNFKLDYESSTYKGDKCFGENVDHEAPILTGANPFLECGSEADVAERSFLEGLVGKGEEDSDGTVNLVSDEKTSRETLLSVPEFDVCNSTELSISDQNEDQEQSDQDTSSDAYSTESIMPSTAEETIDDTQRVAHSASFMPSIPEETNDDTSSQAHSADSVMPSTADETNDHTSIVTHSSSFLPSTAEEANDDTSKESYSAKSIMPSTPEETNDCNQAQEEHFNNQVKTGSINDDVDSSPPATSGKEEDLKSTESQPTNETLSLPSIENETVDSRTASSRSFFIQHGYGETSFSTTGPLSGPIPYYGPTPYSGSTSLRSDSSTTSARSLTFPVLNTEWISSPVRMAKADRKHLRKQRGWLLSLLCCRF